MHAPQERRSLKPTRTVCPTCLRPLLGETYEAEGRVWLTRVCPEHGEALGLVASDRAGYWLRDEVPHPPPGEDECCAVGPTHRTCVALLELTDACNLRCPACYARSPAGAHRPLDDLQRMLATFLRERGPLDVLQLSGGEPTIHPDFFAILDYARRAPITHTMVNTNGVRLADDPTFAAELARRKPRIELYLQMDGFDPAAHVALRGRDLLALKRRALDRVVEHDLPTTLVCTVVPGVNDHEVGELLRLGLSVPAIRGVSLQPATSAGRFDAPFDPRARATVADVLDGVDAQFGGTVRRSDFRPLPCSNPNCCAFTFVRRTRTAPPLPLTRVLRIEDHLDRVKDRISFDVRDAASCCGIEVAPDEVFRVTVKPFMDAWTYDEDRVDECCTHLIRPDGSGVSFCRHNVLERGRSDRGRS